MPQSLSNILLHVVFSTKNREPFLGSPSMLRETHQYVGGISRKLEAPSAVVGGVADHIHILTAFPRTLSVCDYVKEVKRVSSVWLGGSKGVRGFSWQSGYGAFSVSESQRNKVIEYIQRQEQHHRAISFQDEYRSFLKRNNMTIDEKYLWD